MFAVRAAQNADANITHNTVMRRPYQYILFVIVLLSLGLCPAFAISKKVQMSDAPFTPCNVCDVIVLNSSMISAQTTSVPRGEVVNVIAWASNKQDVLVELKDGSRGYMPALSFVENGLVVNVGDQQFWAGFFNERQNGVEPHFSSFLKEGTYRFVDAKKWSVTKDGITPSYLVVKSTSRGEKYYVSNAAKHVSYTGMDIRSLCPPNLRDLPMESFQEKTLFFDDGARHTISNYIGMTRTELQSVLGEPDAWMSASRSKAKETELFFRNVCFIDHLYSQYITKGAVFYIDKNGVVTEAYPDAYISLLKKGVDFKRLPIPGKNPAETRKEDRKRDAVLAWEAFVDTVSSYLGGPPIMIIVYVFIFAVLCCLVERLKLRLGLKIGSNKFAKVSSYLLVAISTIFFAFIFLYSYHGLINLLSFAVAIIVPLAFPFKKIDQCRCEKCGRYMDGRHIIDTKRGPVLTGRYKDKVRVDHGVRFEYEPLHDGFYKQIKTNYETFEIRDHTYHYQDLLVTKKCSHCGHVWQYKDVDILDNSYEVLERFTEEDTSIEEYGDLIDPDTGERFTVMRYENGHMVDSRGDVYEERSDGIYKTDRHTTPWY